MANFLGISQFSMFSFQNSTSKKPKKSSFPHRFFIINHRLWRDFGWKNSILSGLIRKHEIITNCCAAMKNRFLGSMRNVRDNDTKPQHEKNSANRARQIDNKFPTFISKASVNQKPEAVIKMCTLKKYATHFVVRLFVSGYKELHFRFGGLSSKQIAGRKQGYPSHSNITHSAATQGNPTSG